jgi:hypothetical protein
MLVMHQPETIDLPIITLDDPNAYPPGFHILTESRVSWFQVADALPRHERFRSDTVGLTDRH